MPRNQSSTYKKSNTSVIMAIPADVEEVVEKHIKLMISQTETYLPFIRVAFPYSNNVADGVYNLIIGSALSIFVNQFAMKMKNPTVDDFTEFGKIALKYRDQVDQFFK
ncbi:MAG: hypothetical protein ACW9XH_02930 [Candidatus Nitrosopumilus sp. bin_32a]